MCTLRVAHIRLAIGAELGRIVPGDPGIVNEQLNTLGFLLAQVVVKLLDFVLVAYVSHEGNDLSRPGVVELLGFLEHLFSSRCDVDLRTVGNQGLGDHQANASASAGHKSRDMRYVEELGALELVVVCLAAHVFDWEIGYPGNLREESVASCG